MGRHHPADPGNEHCQGVAAVAEAEGAARLGPNDRKDGRGQLGGERLGHGQVAAGARNCDRGGRRHAVRPQLLYFFQECTLQLAVAKIEHWPADSNRFF